MSHTLIQWCSIRNIRHQTIIYKGSRKQLIFRSSKYGNVLEHVHPCSMSHVVKFLIYFGVQGVTILIDVGSYMHCHFFRINDPKLSVYTFKSRDNLPILASLGNTIRSSYIGSCFQVWCANVLTPLPIDNVKFFICWKEVTVGTLSFRKLLVGILLRIHLRIF